MKITIIGSGNIGRTMGAKWQAAGHEVTFGVRNLDSPKTLATKAELNGKVSFQLIQDAIPSSEIVLFATPWDSVGELVPSFAGMLTDKVLIDATNNFGGPVINNLEVFTDYIPDAIVYRAFNSLGWELFRDASINGQQIDHFFCGPDGENRKKLERLIEDTGLRPIWVGDLDRINVVDQLGALWVTLAFQRKMGRNIALKLLGT